MNRTKRRTDFLSRFCPGIFTVLLFLTWPLQSSAQTEIIVYDGNTGINSISMLGDTARIINLQPNSPAEKAGIMLRDQIISINDSLVAGRGLNFRQVKDYLFDANGKTLQLEIKRRGEDSLLTFAFQRDLFLHGIEAFEYEYLIDSLEQWDIQDLLSGRLDSQFQNPLVSKSTVYSVADGSRAAELGIRPGDQVVSLMDLLDREAFLNVGSDVLSRVAMDTSFTIRRGDTLLYFNEPPTNKHGLEGVYSWFDKDFSHACAWLKITMVNRISDDRDYLFNFPNMAGTDSLNVYLPASSGDIIEKRSGILIPVGERDFVYKDWHAVTLPLVRDSTQTFYLRYKSYASIGGPVMWVIAKDGMVQYDRIERMVLFVLLGMMLIISVFFFILFFAIQGRQYIYFALYIFFTAAFLFVAGGYLGEFMWKENVYQSVLVSSASSFIVSLLTACFLLFGNAYLELKKHLRGWYWAVVVLLGLIGFRVLYMLLASLLDFQMGEVLEAVVLISWGLAVGFIPLFILILPAIFRIQKGFQPAWYFLVANLVLMPLTIITLLRVSVTFSVQSNTDSILLSILQVSGVYVAAVIQILIFSFGIAKKMRLDEQEHKRAQLKIIDQLRENEKLKDKVNRELEQKVQERTREIREQKEEIEAQRDEIEAQRDLVFAQKKEITDSIDYAQRIQAAILPHKSYLDEVIPEYFVLFKPRDIVSGDFYWIKEVDSSVVVVAADCTGHGVPGAFMSMLGITLLTEQLGQERVERPGEILGQLRSKIKQMFVQEGTIREQKDGIDMAIAVIDKKKKELQFAGAYNPLYLLRNKKQSSVREITAEEPLEGDHSLLYELKGDKQPIGVHWEETRFTNQLVKLQPGDTVYVFSDGYVDQYGGAHRKKFKTHKFKELLLSLQTESMERQKQVLEETFENWKGNIEQIDDVCVVGIRV
jgi:serine phosphatase RsbU (regulator of sigma subunit)